MCRVYVSKADISPLEEQAAAAAIQSGWVAPLGPDVDGFEEEMARRLGVRGALALTSGTAALHLALLQTGASPGKAVIVPSMTFAATANAVAYTGATLIFIDAQLSDGNVDPDLLLGAVDTLMNEGKTIAAVMTVGLFGRCAEYDKLVAPLAERGIVLIEDAAEAVGASYGGKPAGTFGLAGALSFNGNKIMTTSGGGMLVSDDLAFIDRARNLSAQARQPFPWYEHAEVGYNYRLSNVLAAIGRAQLSRLDDMMARRREIRRRYVSGLSGLSGVRFLGVGGDRDDSGDNSWLTCLVLDPNATSWTRDALIKVLDDADIEARHLWKPMHAQPVFAGCRAFLNGASDELFANGVSIPSGSGLSDQDVDRVLSVVQTSLRRLA